VPTELPPQVEEVINLLRAKGYAAYAVGDCVRSLLCGETPEDWDVITNADFSQIKKIFQNYTIYTDRLVYGELVLVVSGMAVLVAPYRRGTDENGAPLFTDSLLQDLAARRFSFNAIAFNKEEGFVDPFGAKESLISGEKRIRAIALDEHDKQVCPFENSPESMLRALEYHAAGGYTMSGETARDLAGYKHKAAKIPPSEAKPLLCGILSGRNVGQTLEEYAGVFLCLLPELAAMKDYDQHSPEHFYDLLTHTFKCVGYCSPILPLRIAALFHAVGKPDCRSFDRNGKARYYGHAKRSSMLARRALTRLTFEENEIDEICWLIEHHDSRLGVDRRGLKLCLRRMPPGRLKMLLQFRYADTKAFSPELGGAAEEFKRLVDAVNEITAMKECYTYSQLEINRYDIMKLGADEQTTAELLDMVLDTVLDNPSLNTRSQLMSLAERVLGVNA
jgi:tRNA nucleotidyltransferase (CCA-adding enzyme)